MQNGSTQLPSTILKEKEVISCPGQMVFSWIKMYKFIKYTLDLNNLGTRNILITGIPKRITIIIIVCVVSEYRIKVGLLIKNLTFSTEFSLTLSPHFKL